MLSSTTKLHSDLKLLPVYWSRQHGAYITLISSWIIGPIYGGYQIPQWYAIFLLLAGLNFTELLSEKINRKTKLPSLKLNWLWIYGTISFFFTVYFLYNSDTFRSAFPFFTLYGIAFIALSKKRLQKKFIPEMITFFFFAAAGFIGNAITDWTETLSMIISIALLFASSIFTVKERFGKVSNKAILIYFFPASLILLLLFGATIFSIALIILLGIKTLAYVVYPRFINSLPIKMIGISEGIFQLAMILILVLV